MHSCIYEGWVRHRRFEPCVHEFCYQIYMMYLDLDELPGLFDPFVFWSAKRPSVSWFRRSEHLGPSDEPLDISVRNLVQQRTGRKITGPIRLLTSLRQFGFQMNPVSYFYCFDSSGKHLRAVVAEVNNTPWGEQHSYVIEFPQNGEPDAGSRISTKVFHVSPFMPMDMRYNWHLPTPGEQAQIHIRNEWGATDDDDESATSSRETSGKPPFDVTMALKRIPITHRSMARILIRHPMISAKVFAGIYWQAFRLWWKNVPFVPHPKKVADSASMHKTQSVDQSVQSSVQA